MPGFFKLTENKSIVDIKIDEQRNILYSQCTSLDETTLYQTLVEVFDLGKLSNEFKKIATIRQYEVVERMFEFWGRDTKIKGRDIFEIAADFKIIYISPVTFSESRQWHLLLVTQNGYRIFIRFELDQVSEPSEEELKKSDAIVDFIIDLRFKKYWSIAEIMYLPEEDNFVDEINMH
jgi:hypothetical protein